MIKRFQMYTGYVQRQEVYSILDTDTGEYYGHARFQGDLDDLCELLNTLNDEITRLRDRKYD